MQDFQDTFVVVVGGLRGSEKSPPAGKKSLGIAREFYDFVVQSLPGATVIAPDCRIQLWSLKHPEIMAQELSQEISHAFDEAKKSRTFRQVFLIGFSTGGLILRRAYAVGRGLDRAGSLTSGRTEWSGKVSKIVYLSSILRGWSISSATPPLARLTYQPFQWAGQFLDLVTLGKVKLLSREIERHQPFVIETQIQQAKLEAQMSAQAQATPMTVHVLGSRDEFISPLDCLDAIPKAEHLFVELPNTCHVEMLDANSTGSTTEAGRRGKILAQVFRAADANELRSANPDELVGWDDINDYYDELDRPPNIPRGASTAHEVKHAVMIVHGIRDHGYWTKRIAKILKRRTETQVLRAPSPSYGYFNLVDFVRWPKRQRQAKWFMQQYADVRACYPNAEISFVGHSNGTYLAGRALAYSPAIEFRNIYFAGSVLPTSFQWSDYKAQVSGRVLNVMGPRDEVVAFLPGGIEGLGLSWMFGVGAAGYLGFSSNDVVDAPACVEVVNRRQPGNHRAGVDESVWNKIGDFILEDKVMDEPELSDPWWRLLAVKAPGLAPLVIVGALLLLIWAGFVLGGMSTAVLVTFLIAIVALKV